MSAVFLAASASSSASGLKSFRFRLQFFAASVENSKSEASKPSAATASARGFLARC